MASLMGERKSDSCFEVVPMDNVSATLVIGIEPVFPTVIHFSSLTCAHEVALYNAILLLLVSLGEEVIGSTFDHAVAATQIP
jgi:hypothetical protein